MKDKGNKINCKNTFKNDNLEKRKKEFNQKWITIIDLYEKGKPH